MYTHNNLLIDLTRFRDEGLEVCSIGKTELGCDIPYVFLGDKAADKKIIVQGAIHAREHITSELIILLIRQYKDCPPPCGVYFIPMVNIDGVRLCQEGTGFIRCSKRRDFVNRININDNGDFTEWKANINAVDLNTNFPARWGTGRQNVFKPAFANFVGASPCSEAETRALMYFTQKIKPASTISYHIRGEEIYWEFFQEGASRSRDRAIAKRLAAETGYRLIDELASAGGYKDWCVQEFGIPAFTIETGKESYPFPYPYNDLERIFEQNRNVLNTVLESLK